MNKCKCGEKIIFSKKKTFAIPDIRRGICPKCGKEYELCCGKITEIKKEGEMQ